MTGQIKNNKIYKNKAEKFIYFAMKSKGYLVESREKTSGAGWEIQADRKKNGYYIHRAKVNIKFPINLDVQLEKK